MCVEYSVSMEDDTGLEILSLAGKGCGSMLETGCDEPDDDGWAR